MPLLSSTLAATDNIEFTLRDSSGKIKKLFQPYKPFAWLIKNFGVKCPKFFLFGTWENSLKVSNMVVDAGLAGAASRLNGAGAEAAFIYLALGTDSTAVVAGDTALIAEIVDSGLARVAATATRVTTTETNDTAQLATTWSVSGSKTLKEVGVFNAAAAGTMLARSVFADVNVSNGDSFTMTYKVAVA